LFSGVPVPLRAGSTENNKTNDLRTLRLVYLSQVFFFKKKLAENHHVREWALIKLVGAHDDFSAVYKHDIIHLISFNNSFSHRECHLTHSGI